MNTNSNKILSLLETYTTPDTMTIGRQIADNFRTRRVEKNLSREQVAEKAGISVSNVVRFEQKGLISLSNLIHLAIAMGYVSEIKSLFSEPKYHTMEELTQIRKNTHKKRAYNYNEKNR